MALAAFALCLFGGLLWILALALLVPRLLAASVGILASRALRGRAHVSVRALRVYPLAGTAVLHDVVVAIPDAAVNFRELIVACRWWRQWAAVAADAAADATAGARHAFPSVFAVTLDGLRARVVNNTAAFDHLEMLLASAEGSAASSAATSASGRRSDGSQEPGPPAQGTTLAGILLWLKNHTSLRVLSCAVCLHDHGHTGLVRITADVAKFRYGAGPLFAAPVPRPVITAAAATTRHAWRFSLAELRVCVAESADVVLAEAAFPETALCACLGRFRGPKCCFGARCRRSPDTRSSKLLPLVELLSADGVVGEYLVDERIASNVHSALAPLMNRMTVTVRGMRSTFHQASWSAAQDVIERLYPPLYHMADFVEKRDELKNRTPCTPLSIQIEATSKSALDALMTVMFVPRDSTWHKLCLLRVRQWQNGPSPALSDSERMSSDYAAGISDGPSEHPPLPLRGGLGIYGAKLNCSISFAGSRRTDSILHVEVSVPDASVVSTGVFEAPFLRAARLNVDYREQVPGSWNSRRQGKLHIGLDALRILYLADHIHVFEDIAHESSMHSRFANSVRYFVPYDLDLTVICRNGFVLRAGVSHDKAWPDLSAALDSLSIPVAELRGDTASFTFGSQGAVEFSPLLTASRWQIDLSDSELFFLHPFPMSRVDRDSSHEGNEGKLRSLSDVGSPRHWLSKKSTHVPLRSFEHCAGMDVPSSSNSQEAGGLRWLRHLANGSRAGKTVLCRHEVRIALLEGGFTVAAENIVPCLSLPHAVNSAQVHVNASKILLDVNPHHLRHMFGLVENLTGHMGHSLSMQESDVVSKGRQQLAETILKGRRQISSLEAFALGLDPGRLGPARLSQAREDTMAVVCVVSGCDIRLHDLPSAYCPFPVDLTDCLTLGLKKVVLSASSSVLGSSICIACQSDERTTLSSGPESCEVAIDGESGQLDLPRVGICGWHICKRTFLDSGGAPYYSQTDVELGSFAGTLPFSGILALTRFFGSSRFAFGGDSNPVLDSLWSLQVSRVSAENIDVLIPFCAGNVLDLTPGLCHLALDGGFRVCVNNLATEDNLGRTAGTIRDITVNLYSLLSPSTFGKWWGESRLRNGMSSEDVELRGLRHAGVCGPCSLTVFIADHPPFWSSDMAHLQASRLIIADEGRGRLPPIWDSRSKRAITDFLELYSGEWWSFSSPTGACGIDRISVPVASFKVGMHVADCKIEIRPEFFDVLHHSLLYWKIENCAHSRKNVPSDGEVRESPCSESCESEMAYIDLWRHAPGGLQLSAPLQPVDYSLMTFDFTLQSMRITIRSAISLLLDSDSKDFSQHGRSVDAEEFAKEHLSDQAVIDMRKGLHVYTIPSDELRLGRAPATPSCSRSRATVQELRVLVGGRELFSVENATVSRHAADGGWNLRADMNDSANPGASCFGSSVALKVTSVYLGKEVNSSESYAVLGRLLSVYGLMCRAIWMDYATASYVQRKLRESLYSQMLSDANRSGLTNTNREAAGYMICSAIHHSRIQHYGARAQSVGHAVRADNRPVCHLLSSEQSGNVAALRRGCDDGHARNLSSRRDMERDIKNETRSRFSESVRNSLSGLLEVQVASVQVSIFGEPVVRICEFSLKRHDDMRQAISLLAIGSISVSVLDTAVAGILSMVTSVASHTTKASAFLPILIDRNQSELVHSSSTRDAELAERKGTDMHLMSPWSGTNRQSRAISAIRAFRLFRYHSTVERTAHEHPRAMRASPHDVRDSDRSRGVDTLGTWTSLLRRVRHTPPDLSQTDRSNSDKVEAFFRSWSAAARARHRSRSAAEVATPGLISLMSARSMTLIVALGPVTLSYKHSLLLSGVAERRVREPDFRLVLNRSSSSVLFGPSGSFHSILVHSDAASLMSRNEHDCDFHGSLASLRACVSVSPGQTAPGHPRVACSVVFSGIDLSLEAADLSSVILFKNQFKEDVKGMGESLFDAEASVRAMMRATRLVSYESSARPGFKLGDVSVDVSLRSMYISLLGFHPGDKAMRISHESRSVFATAIVSADTHPNLVLGGRLHGHSLAVSASRWYSEERLNFPGLDVGGVHWGDKSDRPIELQMMAGPVSNVISPQGIRNMIFVTSGLMAFHAHHSDVSGLEFNSSPNEQIDYASLIRRSSRSLLGADIHNDKQSERSWLRAFLLAWERTKSVRMHMTTRPMSIALASGMVLATFEVCELAGIVEWNKLVTEGVQLNLAVAVPVVSFTYGRHPHSVIENSVREEISLSIDFEAIRIDILKRQHAKLHKFVSRLRLAGVKSCVQPVDFMEDAAVWADEQDLIRDIQEIQIDVSASTRAKSALPSQTDSELAHEHRLLELGLEVGSALLRVPLLIEDSGASSRLSLQFSSIQLHVRLGDEVALASEVNLAKARLDSVSILWDGLDLLQASKTELMFAVRRRPKHATALLGSLRGSVFLESWVISPRHDIAIAIVDARISKQYVSSRQAVARLGSIPERLARSSSASTSGIESRIMIESRMLFESVEVFIKPSPGYIEGLDGDLDTSMSFLKPRAGRTERPGTDDRSRLHLPIPVFGVCLVRSPYHDFDLLDINFARKQQDEFPDGCLAKAARLFSDLYGAVASRMTISPVEGSTIVKETSHSAAHIDVSSRNWSALVRFGESRFVAREDVYARLRTRFSFEAGRGSGVLASLLSSRGDGTILGRTTVVSGVSPVFKLEVHPELENTKPQSLTLHRVKIVQCYEHAIPPHFAVHVGQVKADMDVVTLLLSREYLKRDRVVPSNASKDEPAEALEAVVPASRHVTLDLASAAPAESKFVLVIGAAAGTSDATATRNSIPAGSAFLCRLFLSQPDGKVGLKVNKIHLEFSRESTESISEKMLIADAHVAISQVSSFADWEHLSANWGFHSLRFRIDAPDDWKGRAQTSGLALIAHKIEFKCKRDDCDALKLDVDGAAAAIRLGDSSNDFQTSLQSTNVDAYISSSTGKTIKRLRQLYSRLLRGLRPQVERHAVKDLRRDRTRYAPSRDSIGYSASPGGANWRRERGHPIPTPPVSVSPEHSGSRAIPRPDVSENEPVGIAGTPSSRQPMTTSPGQFPFGHIVVSGDRFVVTMHGFSFDDNQPQAKLMFTAYDLTYIQRRATFGDFGFVAGSVHQVHRLFLLRYDLLDVKYSDQRQHSVTVMSLPDPHLQFAIVEGENEPVRVEFATNFTSAVDISPSVSHYDYIRQLMSLYRNVSIVSLASTLSEIDGKVATAGETELESSSSNLRAGNGVALRDVQALMSKNAKNEADDEEPQGVYLKSTRWGGREVSFGKLIFAPRLRPLGDLTPDVSVVLGWLGVGGIEALPAGLYDVAVVPCSVWLDRLANLRDGGCLSTNHWQ